MFRRIIWLCVLMGLCCPLGRAQYVTLTGALQGANGLSANGYTLTLQPTQFFFIAGTGVVISSPVSCATSASGVVVGTIDPTNTLSLVSSFTGTLPAGLYYVEYAWYDATGNMTLPSAEQTVRLTTSGSLAIFPPASGMPATAAGMRVYIGGTSGSETLQGSTSGTEAFTQSTPLTTGAVPPSTNSTICKVVANDAGWPTGTGYKVTLADPSGNTLPSYPMQWRLLGPNTTVNLSNGFPTYNGLVTYPVPILAQPLNHATQSISGGLNLTGYNLTGVGALGIGTSLPAWPLDVENGPINSTVGYLVNGNAGTANQCLASGGTAGTDQWIDCLTSVNQFYQTIEANGTAQTQRSALNFSGNFSVTDSSSPSATSIDLANTTVTAGAYSAANITVDAKGRITAAASGPGSTFTGTSGYQAEPSGLILEWVNGPSEGANFYGDVSVTLPFAFPHACLSVQLTTNVASTLGSNHAAAYVNYLESCTTTTITAYMDVGADGIGSVSHNLAAFAIGW